MAAYCSVDDVTQYLDISGSGDDALISGLIDRASEGIEKYTRRKFAAAADATRNFDARGDHIDGSDLWLDEDLCAITSVTNGDSTTVTSSQYVTLPSNETPYYAIRLRSDASLAWTYDTYWEDIIAIVGRWAYSVTPPEDVRMAAISWAAFLYRRRDAAITDVTAVEVGVVVRPIAMPGDAKQLLDNYKKV